jgi:O-antigen/teichoic acid export membrane protein
MSLIKKIVGQSAVYFLSTVASVVVGFFFKIYLSRILGAEALGIYSLGITVISILGIFLSLGYGNGLIRFVSKYKTTKQSERLSAYLTSTLFINTIIAIPIFLLFVLFPHAIAVNLLNTPSLEEYIPIFGVMMVVNSFIVIAEQLIRGLQEVRKSTVINTFIRLPFKIGLVVLFFSWGFELEGYIAAELFGSILVLVLFSLLLKHLLKPVVKLSWRNVLKLNKEEKKYSTNLLITNAVAALRNHGDKILLVYYLSTFELGIYSVVLTIASFIPMVLTSVNSIFSPIISQLHAENRVKELNHYFQLSGRYVFVLSFPLMVFLFLFADDIMLVFGKDFMEGGTLLLFVVIGQIINVSLGSVGSMLQMCGYEKQMRDISIVSSVTSFLLYFFLISKWGLIGLGLVYIFNLFFMNTACSYVLYNKLKIKIIHSSYTKIIGLFLLLFIPCYYFVSLNLIVVNTLILFAALLIIYLLYLVFWYLFFGKKDLPLILKTLKFKS